MSGGGGGGFFSCNPHMQQRAKEGGLGCRAGGRMDGVREKKGFFFVAGGEQLSPETLTDSPARGSHQAEA